MRKTHTGMAALVLAAAMLAGTPAAQATAVKIKKALTATGIDPSAAGKIKVTVRQHGGTSGKLDVLAKHLRPDASYAVTVRGVRIGTLATNGGGNGKARFRSVPKSALDQPLGVDPRGEHLAVDDDGDEVLETEVDDDGLDPDHVRCCLAGHEEDGPECEDMTADACAAHGGTNLGAGSCLPNPCGDSTGGALIQCCKNDDDEQECDLTTEVSCSQHHGVDIGAGSCAPEACGPGHPGEDEIRCCIAESHHGHDGGGTEVGCEHMTADACIAAGGSNVGAGSCEDDPCSSSPSGAFVE
ncbi:MAG: hypothetical protein U0807_05985 [Candidatus Binatia bacterium]